MRPLAGGGICTKSLPISETIERIQKVIRSISAGVHRLSTPRFSSTPSVRPLIDDSSFCAYREIARG
jgi:hypothetical protein